MRISVLFLRIGDSIPERQAARRGAAKKRPATVVMQWSGLREKDRVPRTAAGIDHRFSFPATMTTLTTPNSRDLDHARAMARVLDTAVGIPGTPLRIGLDAVLGVIPGAGDLIAAGLSGYIILTAQRAGAPPAVLWRMLGNVIIDTAIGSIPVLGDLFDVAFKSNAKNVALLERYTVEPGRVTASSRRMGVLVLVAVGLALVGAVAAGFFVARALWRLLTG